MRQLLFIAAALGITTFAQAQAPVPFLTASGKYQFVNPETMQPVSQYTFDNATAFSEGVAIAANENRNIYVGENGEPAINTVYDAATPFHDGRAVVYKNAMQRLINKQGVAIQLYDKIQDWTLSEERAAITDAKGNVGFINTNTGLQTVRTLYQDARGYSEGLAAVKINNKWGFIDKLGKVTATADYNNVMDFGDGFAAVQVHNKWGVINRNGDMVIAPRYLAITKFSEGLAFAKIAEGIWGEIDTKGHATTQPLRFQTIKSLSEGLAPYQKENVWGFLNARGEVVIPAQYTTVTGFSNGLAVVVKDGSKFYINKSGQEFRAKK